MGETVGLLEETLRRLGAREEADGWLDREPERAGVRERTVAEVAAALAASPSRIVCLGALTATEKDGADGRADADAPGELVVGAICELERGRAARAEAERAASAAAIPAEFCSSRNLLYASSWMRSCSAWLMVRLVRAMWGLG